MSNRTDIQIYRFIQYEAKQGRQHEAIQKLFDRARAAKKTYREAMRNVVTLPPVEPTMEVKRAECWRLRADLFYRELKQKIEEVICEN